MQEVVAHVPHVQALLFSILGVEIKLCLKRFEEPIDGLEFRPCFGVLQPSAGVEQPWWKHFRERRGVRPTPCNEVTDHLSEG